MRRLVGVCCHCEEGGFRLTKQSRNFIYYGTGLLRRKASSQ
jgi:hypothetical protein